LHIGWKFLNTGLALKVSEKVLYLDWSPIQHKPNPPNPPAEGEDADESIAVHTYSTCIQLIARMMGHFLENPTQLSILEAYEPAPRVTSVRNALILPSLPCLSFLALRNPCLGRDTAYYRGRRHSLALLSYISCCSRSIVPLLLLIHL
jgi:hypothetical protein